MNTCPGHFGGIKLPLPVYSPYTFDFVLKVCLCLWLFSKSFVIILAVVCCNENNIVMVHL